LHELVYALVCALAPDPPLRADVGAATGARGAPTGAHQRPSAAVVRVARMEQWLTARAEHDPAAQPAADLGLWVLEHLEH
jgi:hypothetical protein